jgi:hypothetical protein
MNVSEVEIWGGWPTVIVVLLIGVVVTALAIDSNKNSAFQEISEACKVEKSENCNELIKFGVAPELYLSNKDYQKLIDTKAIDAINSNSAMASTLANFTLEYVGDKKVKLALEIIEELERLSDSSK